MLLTVAVMLPSCGGGNNGGGGGGGGGNNNPVPHITSISPSQVAAGSQLNYATVTGTNFMSTSVVTMGGTVCEAGFIGSTQVYCSPSASQLAATGQYPVVVTNPSPGGGASNSMNFVVTTGTPTGNFNLTITATGGAFTHTTSLYLNVQ